MSTPAIDASSSPSPSQPFRDLARLLADDTVEPDAPRSLLAMLVQVTGLDCAYVSRVDEARDRFEVVVSQGAGPPGLNVPEGVTAPWSESLCKRAFDAGLAHTDQAAQLFPDNIGVRALKIRSYVGQPIRGRDGATIGTLCAVSGQAVPVPAAAVQMVELFTRLLALQIEHDRVVKEACQAFVSDTADALAGAMARSEEPARLENQLRQVFGMDPWQLGC